MITVSITGYGNYQISNEKLQELLNWLAQNQGVQIQHENQTHGNFHGKQLIRG